MKKNVCVIGAGPSGLVAIKELLDEGHSVTCFEQACEPGGVFRENIGSDEAGAYESTMLTISNYMMTFSSSPPPAHEPRQFWSAARYRRYLLDFAERFDLGRTIRYQTEVLGIAKNKTGGYTVDVASADDPRGVVAHQFDAVAISTGTHRVPNYVDLPGQEEFEGEILHSAHYRNNTPFEGRKVLCVGIGETAADVVDEIARVAASCTLSVRRFQPVVERYPGGGPHTNDAFTSQLLRSVPLAIANPVMRFGNKRNRTKADNPVSRAVAEWNSKNPAFFNHFLTKNEGFIHRIVDGKLTVNASGIERLGKDYVQFKDGTRRPIDTIMLNTGYREDFNILKDIDASDVRTMYKHMIHPDLGAGVVFIGWARPAAGGVPACSEMQARYFALLLSGKRELPDRYQLRKLIDRQSSFENTVFHGNPNLRTLVHYNHYMLDFAKVLGCSPWRAAAFKNPRLVYRLFAGSQMPTVFRLFGPHADFDAARRSIMSVPVAFKPRMVIGVLAVIAVSRALIALRLMKPDPVYGG
ncbi:dimethylaniline monooxygenase (N-oxide forming) [Actinokineospora alba]|uniref:Dimethylaniline monooxygenase (N-oxide forming) n=1 Tax=Actinokineospora alba TaxID=504798 RepID=A0A1H0FXQ4_9PSEU|nr:NAD(P)-binding domain-containing protein [Actinokineospora alba]TDP69669.1 dimethylaniline monooxygenase (N-oxide forming) [Actinokineospora alba]SDI11608.1 dimethylaniline monooxygenase (N-oxide forming) [Actinokineospora alba]SDN99352.1 dimethylaniline monooxygenase (N-oxide forming) [Actinokineospora alba]